MTEDKHDHPAHYGGKDNPYEAIVVIEAWGASFCGGNALKYICRAGKKKGESALDDLKKAKWYLERAVDHANALADGAPTDKTSDYTTTRVIEAWGLSGALAACVTAIGANISFVALRHIDNHIIALLETKKETPAP